jgi:hypothetical protein
LFCLVVVGAPENSVMFVKQLLSPTPKDEKDDEHRHNDDGASLYFKKGHHHQRYEFSFSLPFF